MAVSKFIKSSPSCVVKPRRTSYRFFFAVFFAATFLAVFFAVRFFGADFFFVPTDFHLHFVIIFGTSMALRQRNLYSAGKHLASFFAIELTLSS